MSKPYLPEEAGFIRLPQEEDDAVVLVRVSAILAVEPAHDFKSGEPKGSNVITAYQEPFQTTLHPNEVLAKIANAAGHQR